MILHDVLVDALAEARLEKMHLTDHEIRLGTPSWEVRTRARGRPWETAAPRAPSAPSLRVRLGRALLALGAAVAGEDETAPAGRVA